MSAPQTFHINFTYNVGVSVAVLIKRLLDGQWWDGTLLGQPTAKTALPVVLVPDAAPANHNTALTISTLPIPPATTTFWQDGQYLVLPYVWSTITTPPQLGMPFAGTSMTFTLVNGSDAPPKPVIVQVVSNALISGP